MVNLVLVATVEIDTTGAGTRRPYSQATQPSSTTIVTRSGARTDRVSAGVRISPAATSTRPRSSGWRWKRRS